MLLPLDKAQLPNLNTIGYVYPHKALPEGVVLWREVQQVEGSCIRVWVTNFSERPIVIEQNTPVAIWEMDNDADIVLADKLLDRMKMYATEAKQQHGEQPRVLKLLATDNGEQWEWDDDHLYLDVSRTPVGRTDPAVDSSLGQLQSAWEQGVQDLGPDRRWRYDDCAKLTGTLQHLARINERGRLIDLATEEAKDLPPSLNLHEGYDHLSVEERIHLKEVLCSEATFFMKGKYPKIIRSNNPVVINTGDAAPRTSGFRRLSQQEQAVVDEYVEKLLAADVVEACNGPWSSPILLVPKKDGGLRAVADLRKVNECVLADSYAMPDTQELLDQLAGSHWFSSLDLSSAFWQLPLAEGSRDCTAFMTKTHGLLRWKALPMGFKNSSAYFQREIDAALKGLRLTCCVIYIDDVVVHSSGTFDDHMRKLKAVLRALRTVGFSGNPTKCKFAQKEVVFLGHRVADGKVYALEDKVKAMLEYKRPTTLRGLRGF